MLSIPQYSIYYQKMPEFYANLQFLWILKVDWEKNCPFLPSLPYAAGSNFCHLQGHILSVHHRDSALQKLIDVCAVYADANNIDIVFNVKKTV